MKITILQENLKKALGIVSGVAGKNQSLPILNNVAIKTKDNNIFLMATNLEIGIMTKLRGKVEKDGSYTVDAKIFSNYISLLPNKKINISLVDDALKVDTENYHTSIKGDSIDEFPLIPSFKKSDFFKIKTKTLKKALSQVMFAVSSNESRMELTGVFFNIEDGDLFMVATDSFRLAEKKMKIETNIKKNSFIVPIKTLQELTKAISVVEQDGVFDGDVSFYISDNQIIIELQDTEIFSRLIEGQYPDYKQIIPVNFKTDVQADKSELIRAIKITSIFSKADINDVSLDFPQGKKELIVSSSTQNGENIAHIEAQIKGDDNSVVLNYKYLLDGLNSIVDSKINLSIYDSSSPCVLKDEKDDYLYIIMPIKQ